MAYTARGCEEVLWVAATPELWCLPRSWVGGVCARWALQLLRTGCEAEDKG